MNPEELSTRVLDAAGHGQVVPGYERVGEMLGQLRHTRVIGLGEALSSSAVAVATDGTTPSLTAAALARVRPGGILIGAVGVVIGALFFGGGGDSRSPTSVGQDPPAVGVERVVARVDETDPVQEPDVASRDSMSVGDDPGDVVADPVTEGPVTSTGEEASSESSTSLTLPARLADDPVAEPTPTDGSGTVAETAESGVADAAESGEIGQGGDGAGTESTGNNGNDKDVGNANGKPGTGSQRGGGGRPDGP